MFDQLSGTSMALLWQTGIMGALFILFTFITFKPLIKFLEYLVHKVIELNKINAQIEVQKAKKAERKNDGENADKQPDT